MVVVVVWKSLNNYQEFRDREKPVNDLLIPHCFANVRADLPELRLRDVNLHVFTSEHRFDADDDQWSFGYHMKCLRFKKEPYCTQFWQMFDSTLYLVTVIRAVNIEKHFIIAMCLLIFNVLLMVSTLTPQMLIFYTLMRFEFENCLFKASEINTDEFSDRVYSSTPYVSMGSNCLSHIRKFHKSSVYSLGTGLDFGSYRDVCDIYDLFRGEMIFIENY